MVQDFEPEPPPLIPFIGLAVEKRSSGSISRQRGSHLGRKDEENAASVVDHDKQELDDG